MGISRDNLHKRRKTGGKRPITRKKRKYELGRPAASTKIGAQRVHSVRVRGGNIKRRALRLDHGNFSWGSERCGRKSRIVDVVYNASNNELVRTKTLVKNCIVLIDATPFRHWYENHYAIAMAGKKSSRVNPKAGKEKEAESSKLLEGKGKSTQLKYRLRQKVAKLDPAIEDQLQSGRILACLSSRPGQVGHADGYILEGKELEFYLRKIKAKKGK